jgi:hypothetical protein
MATTPAVAKDAKHNNDPIVQPQPPGPAPDKVTGYRPTLGVAGKPLEDGARDPDTVAEEQRERSEEIAKIGVQKWVDARDERPEDERTNRQVPGVAPPVERKK